MRICRKGEMDLKKQLEILEDQQMRVSVPINSSPKKDAQSNETVNILIEHGESPSKTPKLTDEQKLQADAKDKLQRLKL